MVEEYTKERIYKEILKCKDQMVEEYNLYPLLLTGSHLADIGDMFIDTIFEITPDSEKPFVDAVGGMTMASEFIIASILTTIGNGNKGCVLRSKKKDHGTEVSIENQLPPGADIVIVDDLLVTGKTMQITCDTFLNAGYSIEGIIVLLKQGDFDMITLGKKYNCEARALFHAP